MRRIAEHVVAERLESIGIDVTDAAARDAIRRDIVSLRAWREFWDSFRKVGAVLAAAIATVFGTVWLWLSRQHS